MICTYCRSQNGPEDHRCQRCGRRLSDDVQSRRHMFPVQVTAAAPKLEDSYEPHAEAVDVPPPARPQLVAMPPRSAAPQAPPGGQDVVQPSLFGPQLVSSADVPRVMSVRGGTSVPMSPAPSARRKAARANHPQPSLFDATYDGSRALPTSVEAALYCDAEVGSAGDRCFAAAVDVLVPVAGYGVFLAAFWFTTGGIEMESRLYPWFGATLALIVVLYRVAWAMAGVDSPGLQAANLRLLTFDGRMPRRRARLCRILGGLVSAASVGIGLLWSLLDEERLTWHDRMTGTFPARRN